MNLSNENNQSANKFSGRRRVRSYTLQKAITPKSCGMFSTPAVTNDPHDSISGAGRVIYVICGLLFVGTGIYNILF